MYVRMIDSCGPLTLRELYFSIKVLFSLATLGSLGGRIFIDFTMGDVPAPCTTADHKHKETSHE